jgi:hypothetical protein
MVRYDDTRRCATARCPATIGMIELGGGVRKSRGDRPVSLTVQMARDCLLPHLREGELFGVNEKHGDYFCDAHGTTAQCLSTFTEDDQIEALRVFTTCVYGFTLFTREAVEAVRDFSPGGVIEIGSGNGYLAYVLARYGVDVKAFDAHPLPENRYFVHPDLPFAPPLWFNVALGGPDAIAPEDRTRTLVLCWPPYDEPMAHESLVRYAGDRLVYVGEGDGGCTADDAFHGELMRSWSLVRTLRLGSWWPGRCWAFFYERGADHGASNGDALTPVA